MQPPENLTRIVNRKRYSTATATLLASDAYWDGHNFERHGRNTFLYRTPKGAYFTVVLSRWQGEPYEQLQPIMYEEAVELYEEMLPEHTVTYEQAFPDITVEEA